MSTQRGALKAELFPMRMVFKNTKQHPVQNFSARVQRIELDVAAGASDFNRRANGCYVPARVSFRILVAGRKINAAIAIQLVEQRSQTLLIGDRGRLARYRDSARRLVNQLWHNEIQGGATRITLATG